MFKRYHYASYVKVFCVQPESAPPQRFLNRFANVKAHVVWASDCDNSGPVMSVRERAEAILGCACPLKRLRGLAGTKPRQSCKHFRMELQLTLPTFENSFSSRELGREHRQAYRRLLIWVVFFVAKLR